jgi:hypothetical protein
MQLKKDRIHNMTCIIFFKMVLLLLLSGCSKSEGTKIITPLPSVNTDNNLQVGASAHDFLNAARYYSVDIEIQYVAGFKPEIESIDNLLAYLNGLLNKNGGIRYSLQPIASTLKDALTLNDIAYIEKNNRTIYNSGGRLGVYILFTDGYYYQENIIGLSYRNTSMCLFGRSIFENSGRPGKPTKIILETSIMQHEFGHLLGLVDMGTTMQVNHEDAFHDYHCSNSACLMSYAFGSSESIKYLIQNTNWVLDPNCKADLKANGGK